MNDNEYRELIHSLELLAQAAATIDEDDLATALATVNRAEAIGPILSPTEFRYAEKDRRLEYQRRLLTAAAGFRAEALLCAEIAREAFEERHTGLEEPAGHLRLIGSDREEGGPGRP